MGTAAPVYAPLQGDQLLKIIMADVQKKLKDHPAFQAYIGHHNARYDFKLTVKSFPYDPERVSSIQIEGTVEQGAGTAPEPVKAALAAEQTGEFKGEKAIVYPNQAREEAGIPTEGKQDDGTGNFSDFAGGTDPFSGAM